MSGAPTDSSERDEDVPLLDDPVEQSLVVDEGLADETFKALLGDAWRESVDDLFKDTRRRIEQDRSEWSPKDTDALADALKIRIDDSVRQWLAETLEANIGRLRERIVSELSTELLSHMREKFDTDLTPRT